MTPDELCFLSAADLGRALARQELSPVEAVEAHLDRIDRYGARLNAFITVTREEAREAARQAEAEIAAGNIRGPLHGVPIGLKDLIYTSGIPTTAASKVLAGFVPEVDATVAARLSAAGAILIGKTNLHEFAFGLNHSLYGHGPSYNPWNLAHIGGGSSGGSGTATAAGLCSASLGTDTAGSVRAPAAFCGLVGIKPTYGLVSRYGVIPQAWSFDAIGPMTRTVEDAALMLQAIAGHDPNDRSSSKRTPASYTSRLKMLPAGLRAGILKEFVDQPMTDETRAAFQTSVGVLRQEGISIREVSAPEILRGGSIWPIIGLSEAATYHQQWLTTRAADYGPDVLESLSIGSMVRATEYLQAQRARTVIRKAVNELFRQVDVILSPTAPGPAPLQGPPTLVVNGVEVPGAFSNFTRLFNITGHPAVTVPCGFSSSGLPLALQLAGRPFDDDLLLQVAAAYERDTDWHRRHPTLEAA